MHVYQPFLLYKGGHSLEVVTQDEKRPYAVRSSILPPITLLGVNTS